MRSVGVFCVMFRVRKSRVWGIGMLGSVMVVVVMVMVVFSFRFWFGFALDAAYGFAEFFGEGDSSCLV